VRGCQNSLREKERERERDESIFLLHSPTLPTPPPFPSLTLTLLRYLTYLCASCHPTVGIILPGWSALRKYRTPHRAVHLARIFSRRKDRHRPGRVRAESRVKGGQRVGESRRARKSGGTRRRRQRRRQRRRRRRRRRRG